MKALARALGKWFIFSLLFFIPLSLLVAGCKSTSGGGSASGEDAAPLAYVSSYGDGMVSVIDTGTDDVVATIELPHPGGRTAVLPKLNRLYVTSLVTNELTVINTRNNRIVRTVTLPGRAGAIVADPKTNKIFIAEHGDPYSALPLLPLGTHIWIMNGSTLASPKEISCGSNLQDLAIDSRNRRVYATDAGSPGVVYPINADTGTVLTAIGCGNEPRGIAVSPDEARAFVTNAGEDSVTVIDTRSGTALGTIAVGSSPKSVAIDTLLGKAVVTNSGDGTVTLIDVATSLEISPSPVIVGSYPVWAAANHSLGKAYVANLGSDTVSVVNLANGGILATVTVGSMPVGISVME
ncbi:MAG TPA: YncE family protein [Deltaproteobacteria bacterium]|jgi:YVTN family beta-propeller protein|nr:YncE family protein [Deltaproteobacteria bacterium]HOI08049.1 YncE family protein [Deltaproteobacteria bacterium]